MNFDVPSRGVADSSLIRVARAAVRCIPSLGQSGRITFSGNLAVDAEWDAWSRTVWEGVMLPFFAEALPACRSGCIRELQSLDRSLDSLLSEEAAARSMVEGERLRDRVPPLQGERVLARLWAGADRGESPGHLATLYAARAAAFFLSDRMARISYLFAESFPGNPPGCSQLIADRIGSASLDASRISEVQEALSAFA